jgi:L-fuculose-phosphate aldolase
VTDVELRLRVELVDAMRRAVADGLSNGTSGNASAMLAEGCVLVTPSGIPPDELKPGAIVLVDADGGVVDDDGSAPTTELALHLAVYAAAPDARAVMHTHSPFATAVACACDELPAVHYDIVAVGGPVRVAPYALFGSDELAAACAAALDDRSAALLANHGAVAYGSSVRQAYDRAAKVEWLAALWWRTRALGEPRVLSASQLDDVRAQMARYRYGEQR